MCSHLLVLNENHISISLVHVFFGTFFQNGQVHVGALRINPVRNMEAYVTVPAFDHDIIIETTTDRNRAFDGDQVVVQLHDKV